MTSPAILLVLLLANSGANPVVNEPDIFIIEHRQFRPNLHFSISDGPPEPMLAALQTEAEWRDLWAQIEPRMSRDMRQLDAHPFPPIDFQHQTLIVAALGSKPTGGYSIAIQSVTESPSHIVVSVIALHPANDCVVTLTVVEPIALALIPKTSKPVEFDMTKAQVLCE